MVDDVLRRGRRFYTPAPRRGFIPSSSRPAPTGWGTAWSGPRTARTSPATTGSRSSASSSTPRRRARPTRRSPRRRPRAAAIRRLADLLRLRRRPGQAEQADRHEDLHARSSPAARARSPATTRRPRCRSATCCATSPGSCPPDRASPARSASRRSPRADLQELAHARRRLRAQHAALVLRPQGGRDRRRRPAPRAGRRADRRRVFIGLLQTDPGSYLATQPRWQPTLPSKNGTFRMTDFLTFAGRRPAVARPVDAACASHQRRCEHRRVFESIRRPFRFTRTERPREGVSVLACPGRFGGVFGG